MDLFEVRQRRGVRGSQQGFEEDHEVEEVDMGEDLASLGGWGGTLDGRFGIGVGHDRHWRLTLTNLFITARRAWPCLAA